MCAQSLYQGKRITVYVHGDPFMPGKQINVNEHQIPEFEGFFSFLTEKIPHRTGGCYRKIFSPNGTKIRSFDQIEAGKSYVAAKNETYRGPNKEYNYKEISQRPRPLHNKKHSKDKTIVPVLHAEKYRDKSGRSYFLNAHSQGLWLKVQVNGDSINPAHRVQVPPSLKGNLMSIKEEIMKSIPFLQVVDRLYKIHNCGGCLENFAEVAEAGELKTGDHLLAVPRMHQLKIDVYDPKGRTNMTVHTSPQNGKHYHFPSFHGNDSPNMFRHNRSLNKHKVLPGIGKNSDSPYSSPGALGNSKHDRRNGRLSDRQEKQKKAKNVDYDRDQGGVYRAKGQTHGHGAHQVNETKDTRTERPIDQMEAEEVSEEDIRSNEKTTPIPKGTELNKQPSTEQKPNASEAGNQTKSQERMDDNAARQSVDEFADESFNRSYNNPSKTNNNEPRSSTPARGDDERRKKEQREHEAAERIQASMKGHLKRQEHKQMKQEQKQQQNDVKADQKKADPMKDKNDTKKKQMTQDEAASKIQAGFKGYAVRKEQNLKKQQGQK